MNRHTFSGSRANRSRREQSYARAVIAAAERLRQQQENKERCLFCADVLTTRDHHPYCSKECGDEAAREGQ